MKRALRIALRGFTPPNPMVGCCIVQHGELVGEGHHHIAGGPHAEIVALNAAGSYAGGATVYVTLEPCSHFGRTPPCADALIAAGVKRVVVAVQDPNPRVAGRGIEQLRASGIQVDLGLLEDQARRLNEAFFHFHRSGLPFVTLKAGATLDGRIATESGESQWITGEAARAHLHLERARSAAVLCGVGTVDADDPMLNARLTPPSPRQPIRVVLDPSLRMHPSSALARSVGESEVIVYHADFAEHAHKQRLLDAGVTLVSVPFSHNNGLDLKAVLSDLGNRGVISLLVEGGGITHGHFLKASWGNRLLWYVAPVVMGDAKSRPVVQGLTIRRLSEMEKYSITSTTRLGEDLLIELRKRVPTAEIEPFKEK